LTNRWYRVLEHSPWLYTSHLQRKNPQAEVARRERDIVIAGYPASGNTFARVSMLRTNPGIDVASHVHSWTQVALAVRLRLPVLVLLRAPVDAVSSMLARFPHHDARTELKSYARLYRRSLQYADNVVVADFEDVTKRFGDVVTRLNSRFGTSFVPLSDDPRTLSDVLDAVDEHDRLVFGAAATLRTARPDAAKEQRKDSIKQELRSPELQPLVEDCERLYRKLLDAAR